MWHIEWDEKKAKSNATKHGVSFDLAQTCFEDEYAEVFSDPEHSDDEYRQILIGLSFDLKTLVVVFTERSVKEHDVIRIISARKATKKEFQFYWGKRSSK
jgi:uncharacterized protein